MGTRWKSKRFLILNSLLFLVPFPLFAGWGTVVEGIEYRKLTTGEARIHYFRIDPSRTRLDLLLASDHQVPHQSAKTFREKTGAGLAVNGGFFDESFRSLGLLVKGGRIVNPVRNAGWGIFQIREGRPAIIHRSEWSPEGVDLALQVGPRLVVNGRIPSFKPESEPHRRSAVGITADGKLLIALCETPIGIGEWAALLSREAPNALNLDGGGSSQISVKLKEFSLEVPGTTGVPNAVAVFSASGTKPGGQRRP